MFNSKQRYPAYLILLLISSSAIAQQWQALPETATSPPDNPTTPEKVELGKMLFFDPRLSSNGTVSCFSCHNVMEGGDDHRTTSIGVHGQAGGRNAPSVWNAAFHSVQFWDGRATSLEDQAKGPPANPIEMGMSDLDAVADRIAKIPGYKTHFNDVFGAGDNITIDNIAKAIAAYERTLITPNSSYDKYVRGDGKAMNEQQIRGMKTFASTGCTGCHSGANFNGPSLPAGEGFFQKFPIFTNNSYVTKYGLMNDTGRMNVTGNIADKNMWRVPTLRNLRYTAPYMHSGTVKSINEAVRVMGKTQLDKDLSDSDVQEIVAFLETLNGEFPIQSMPRLPATPGDLLE
ncbi:MAG: cytochrome-c peroxidase [Candidatus Thiodiazotropha sp. 6PLUC2]